MNKNLFNNFNDLVFQITHQFNVWKFLQDSKNNSGYNAHGSFWITTIVSLQHGFLLNLANIFDEDERYLSVFTLLNGLQDNLLKAEIMEMINHAKFAIIKKRLLQYRNNYLAHKKVEFVDNPAKLMKKFPFKYENIEDTLDLLIQILDKCKKFFDPKNATSYVWFYKEAEIECKVSTKYVLKNGLNSKS